ncbi:BamA/TamA family outer membrane protein [Formosa maritima]|uniref:BamA/TamA family outer membrane protein n=1 Tax=Formosa maritima TaxID=2592046 RepID=A0A5D0GCR2_9FLAO|nr:BamA/TamA family outer membrane protein [Formosa maritima]TYA56685.1 BamA/TamA family outer membrane protein [Formosa maritima]
MKNVDFTVMPFLSYNRNVKFMFGAIPMVMYRTNKQDTISPKSLSGAAGVYTTNKSYFIGIFNKVYFNEDKWRGTLFLAIGDLNSQFFVEEFNSSEFYNYGTNATIFSIGIQRKIVTKLYGGITYTYANYDTVFEDNIADKTTTTTTNGLEFNALYDTRDDVYYPTTGKKIKAKWITFAEWFGNEAKANKIKADYNQYFAMRDQKDVLAARFSSTIGLGNIAFEQQTVVGGNDIRGYSEGKYRGNTVIALQGEYRLNFAKRMGVVGFAGIATLFGSDNEDFDGELLPGVGIGYRYRAFKKEKINIGIDAAVGKDDWGVYFRIGEAF